MSENGTVLCSAAPGCGEYARQLKCPTGHEIHRFSLFLLVMPRLTAIAPPAKYASLIWCLIIFFLLASRSARGQEAERASTLRGVVLDSQGKPAVSAIVHLQPANGAQDLTARTDERGLYSFVSLHKGVYALRAEMSGFADATVQSIFIRQTEAKEIDLTLGPAQTALKPKSSSPEFFDQPQFTVSGVTDTTSLGGHGSDTVTRARDTVAKQTASLGTVPTAAQLPSRAASEAVLRGKVERDPRDFKANCELGEFLISSGRARDALEYLDYAVELEPANYESAYDLALANAEAGNYSRARDGIQTLLVHYDKAEPHHLLAEVQEKLGNPLEAVHEYESAAALDPSEPYFFDWGSELLLHHAPEPAIDVFTQGNHLFPHSARMLIGLGAAWFVSGSYDQAVARICEASDLNAQDLVPYLFLGKIQSAQASAPEVLVAKLHQFVILQPENADANYYYAVALWKQRRSSSDASAIAQVESFLNKAVRLDSNYASAYLLLGVVHSGQGDFPRAISEYQHAIQADAQIQDLVALEEAHYRLSQAYRRIGQEDKAEAELRLYDQAAKESSQQAERERHEILQFVYTLRDQPSVKLQ